MQQQRSRTAARPSVLAWTGAIAVLATTTSVLGLADPDVYAAETDDWALQARGQDVGNLLAVAVLVASGLGRWRGSHRAGLVWLGALLYFVYAFVVYAMAVHFNSLFLAYVAVLGLSTYAAFYAADELRASDRALRRRPHTRLAGWVCVTIGAVLAVLWLAEVVPASLEGDPPSSVVEAGLWVNPIHVIDLAVVLPAFVLAGASALRGRATGLFLAGPMLTFSVLMGSNIVATLTMTLLTDGGGEAVVPLTLVSVLVLVSLLAAVGYLREDGGQEPLVNPRAEGHTEKSR